MKTLSVHQMPDGFEVEVPTFGYWFRVGVALTLGAIVTCTVAWVLYMMLLARVLVGLVRVFWR